jgi:Cof subfamily protein (haloacid dehalogenase superfamily)
MKNESDRLNHPFKHPKLDMIAIDCDGTLLDSAGNLSKGAPQAVHQAQKAGIRIALVTGRSQSSLQFIFKSLKVRGPFIGSGGAYIGDLSTGEVIQQLTLPRIETEELIRMSRRLDLILFLDHTDFMIGEKENERLRQHKAEHGYTWMIVDDLMQKLSILPEKGLVVGDPDKLRQLYDLYMEGEHNVSITYTSPTSMDVLPKGVSKGKALIQLAEHFHIPLKRIAVIGDYLNDLEMFKVAGHSVAMGNAPDKVKQAADWVAPGNDQDGVTEAIYHLLGL